MNRIMGAKSTGKTKQLILLAKERNGIVVCSNPRAMETKAHSYGIIGVDFCSYSDYLYGPHKIGREYYIDDLEKMLPPNVKGYTIDNEE